MYYVQFRSSCIMFNLGHQIIIIVEKNTFITNIGPSLLLAVSNFSDSWLGNLQDKTAQNILICVSELQYPTEKTNKQKNIFNFTSSEQLRRKTADSK
jgi:hypothetical protein